MRRVIIAHASQGSLTAIIVELLATHAGDEIVVEVINEPLPPRAIEMAPDVDFREFIPLPRKGKRTDIPRPKDLYRQVRSRRP